MRTLATEEPEPAHFAALRQTHFVVDLFVTAVLATSKFDTRRGSAKKCDEFRSSRAANGS